MSLNKKVTLQLAQRRNRLKNQIVRKQEDLSRETANPPTITSIIGPGSDTGCAPCGDGILSECEGLEWQQRILAGGNGNVNVIVDGSKATFDTPISDTRNIAEWVDTWANGASLPIEVLYRIKFRWDWDSDSWDFLVQLDAQPDPPGSGLWAYLGFDTTDTGTFGSHTLSIRAQTSTSEPVGSADAIVWTSSTLAEQQDAVAELDVRFRVESGAIKARIWEVGTSEPGAWTFDDSGDLSALDGQLVSLGLTIFGIDNEGGEGGSKNRFEIESIQITEGCQTSPCIETFTRTESGDLGTSEFGGRTSDTTDSFNRPDQEEWGTSDYGIVWDVEHTPVVGDLAEIENGRAVATITGGGTIWGELNGFPEQVLFDGTITVAMRRLNDPTNNNFYVQVSPRLPNGSACLVIVHAMGHSGDPGEVLLTQFSGAPTVANPLAGRDDEVLRDFKIRVQRDWDGGTASTARCKVWWADEEEPAAWLITVTNASIAADLRFPVTGWQSYMTGGSSTEAAITRYEFNELDISGVSECERTVSDQGGYLIGVAPSETSDGTLLVNRLMVFGICSRISPTLYRLPSNATHVSYVLLDTLRATGWTWNPPREIQLAAPVNEDTRVAARYFMT